MDFVFTVTESEAQLLVAALDGLPHKVVRGLFDKLHEQAAKQRVAKHVAEIVSAEAVEAGDEPAA